MKCEFKCVGYCKDNELCNYINGLCYNGCYDGWIGENCIIGWIIYIDKWIVYIIKIYRIVWWIEIKSF